ncbi:hypothetical protein Zm00014a_005922 [Zea mays]|uniref:Uncharacterized protein n=1 Tax=Zea mays TaxID=4577 RepID=A0A3L6FHA1_MAIZE|nr:hypothetical protein Zm00014a_005922 [Zea mays]
MVLQQGCLHSAAAIISIPYFSHCKRCNLQCKSTA